MILQFHLHWMCETDEKHVFKSLYLVLKQIMKTKFFWNLLVDPAFATHTGVRLLIPEWVNNYPQYSCICVPVGSTVFFSCIARRGFLFITTVQVWSRSVSSFVPIVTLTVADTLSVCTKEEQLQWSVFCGLKVYQGPKSTEDFQHSTRTVFCSGGVSMDG